MIPSRGVNARDGQPSKQECGCVMGSETDVFVRTIKVPDVFHVTQPEHTG